ncbi:MAG: prolyl endopeptidase [Rhodospirillales bacterium]|nr:prolyl endopeptidase [Rhodospirillales bacterium]
MVLKILPLVIFYVFLTAWTSVVLAADASAPPTAVKSVSDIYHGVAVADPYRWLENADDPAVKGWSDSQNMYTRAYLDGLAVRGPIKEELTRLISATSPSYYRLKRRGNAIFAMFNQPPKQQPMLSVMPLSADPKAARVIVDPNTINAKGTIAIDWYVPSPDGKRVAVSVSEGGSEDGTLHIFDVATSKEIDDPIANVQYPTAGGSMAWAADGQSFWYTRYPADRPVEDRHFYQHVYFHRIGQPSVGDTDLLGKDIPDAKIAEIQLDDSFDPGHPTAIVENGDSGRFVVYALNADRWIQIAGYHDQIIAATRGPDHALYLVSRSGAPHSKVLKLAPGDLNIRHAQVIVPEDDGAIAPVSEDDEQPFAIAGDRIYVKKLVGGPSRVDIYDLNGKKLGIVPLPDVVAVDEIVPAAKDSVLFSVATYLRPPYFLRYDPATGKAEETGLVQTSPISFDDVEAIRAFAVSKDGTKVPVNIIRRKGISLNGTNPVLLYGYGGYGISMTPRFLGAERRVWLNGGGVYAVANIRGGGEFGEDWHRNGALTHKQNVFDDFFAASQYMVDARYTTGKQLAILGGSNGGLLMGAELTQHPGAFRTVVAQVGIYDMLRVELDPNGTFNTTEFGTVKDPDQFKALYAYSPYHHIQNGTAYPSVLFMTGANDGRVNPLQSRKMAARLQKATSSGQPVYLRTSDDSGHGHGSALSVRIDQGADYLAFLFDQLGMQLATTATH